MADRTPAEIAAELERLSAAFTEALGKADAEGYFSFEDATARADARYALATALVNAYRSGYLHVFSDEEAAMVEAVRAKQKVCVPVVWTTEMKAAAAKAWDDAGGFCDEVGLQAALAAALAAAQGER